MSISSSSRVRRLGALTLGAAWWLTSSVASGLAPLERHPHPIALTSRPAHVPSDYVWTRNGFFHPSCVTLVRSDESVDADRMIRGADGVEHDRIAPCPFPRFTHGGIEVIPTSAGVTRESRAFAAPSSTRPHAYDGWIVWFSLLDGIVPLGWSTVTISTDWVVPAPPLEVGMQDIAFFNGIATYAGGSETEILQPVLDFHDTPSGRWGILSEQCCQGGMDVQTVPILVNVGDVIRGVVKGTGCNSMGVCTSWTITTTDVTTGRSAVLDATSAGRVAQFYPGVLETFNVTACDMLPASPAVTFYDQSVIDNAGKEVPIKYRSQSYESPGGPPIPNEFPTTCGYAATSTGNRFTLVFNAPSDAGARDASVLDSAGGADVGNPVSSGAAGGTSQGAGGGPGGAGNAGAGSGGNGPDGAGGIAGSTSTTSTGPNADAASSAGCSCRTVARVESGNPRDVKPWSTAALATALLLRRKRARPPAPAAEASTRRATQSG